MGRIANQPKIKDLQNAGLLAPKGEIATAPSFPPIPALPTAKSPTYRGPLAPGDSYDVSTLSHWNQPSVPQQRITPPQPAQSAQSGSFVQGAIFPVMVAASAAQLAAEAAQDAANKALAVSFQGAWSAFFSYSKSDQVIDEAGGGGYYIALANNTNKQPSLNPTFWQLVTAGNLNSYEGNFSGVTAYTEGQLVSFQGALWVAIADSTGQTPSLTSSFWSLLGTNSLFTGPWSSTTAYQQNMFASQSGNVYQALTANTNVSPSTNPGTWQLSGPATLDNLVDGSAFQKVLASMVNLVPDSDLINPTVYWPGGGSPITYEVRYPSAPGCPAFFLSGTGSPSSFRFVYSRVMAVVPGTTYTLSGHVNAISVTSGTPSWAIYDPTITTVYAQALQTPGVDGRVSVTFTVPAGVSSVVCLLDSNNCTITSGQALFWFQPQFVAGSNAGAYISSSADYLSGTVLIDFASAAHGNKNLGSVPDGVSSFGQTASGLSYSCLSNPLKGHDSGASAEIDISAFTLRTSSKGDLSISSGSILSLGYSTGYFCYFDDGVLAGGAETFHATTSKGTALQGSGRFFIGSCTTPAAGAPDSLGDNNGGTGVQTGQTLVVLSTAQSPNGTGGYGNLAPTSANTTITGVGASEEQWLGYFSQSSGIPSTITLSITSSVVISGAGVGNAVLRYSVDSGATFTTVYSASVTRALQTDTVNVTLPATVSKIVISAQASHTAGGGSCAHTLSNIQVQVQI